MIDVERPRAFWIVLPLGKWSCVYTKDSSSSYEELTKKECSSVVCASGSACGFLSQVLALAFLNYYPPFTIHRLVEKIV